MIKQFVFLKKILNTSIIVGVVVIAALLFSTCVITTKVTIVGKVYVEDSSVQNAWKTDDWLDYTVTKGVVIRSGDSVTETDDRGFFRLSGDAVTGKILFEASKEGYRTVRLYVVIEDLSRDNVRYTQQVKPVEAIRKAKGGKVSFHNTSSSSSSSNRKNYLEPSDNNVIILLLKQQQGSDWNVFRYTTP